MRSSTSSSSAWGPGAWRGAALFALSFVLTLEVVTRIDQARLYGVSVFDVYSYDRGLMEYDEYGIKGRNGGSYEKWRLNSLGLRGPEANAEPEKHRMRIVALGASETFGLYESADSEWPRALERELQSQNVRSEVLNGAIAGMTTGAQLRHLRHRLLPLKPTVVIWVVHYAAFAGLDPERLDSLIATIPVAPGSPTYAERLSPRVVRRLRDAINPKIPDVVRSFIEEHRFGMQLAIQRSKYGDAFGKLIEVSGDELDAFEEFVARLKRDVNGIGASLIVVLPPRRLDEESLRLQYLSFPNVSRRWLDSAFSEFAASAAEVESKGELCVVDLRGLFGDDVSEFMMDTVHFNDAGALALAKGIAPLIATGHCEPQG